MLVCDDVDMLRELMRYQLEEDDDIVVVGEAANGVDSVRLATELEPDVVLLDLAMPGIDGLEAITMIQEIPKPPIVVVYSGFDASTMRDRVLRLGAAAYVEKGGDLNAVKDTVREVMRRPAP